jgi:hypothetical protein
VPTLSLAVCIEKEWIQRAIQQPCSPVLVVSSWTKKAALIMSIFNVPLGVEH